MKTLALAQGSPEWHAWRLGHIGGSQAAAVVGECPYNTRLTLWNDFRGIASDLDDDPSKEFIFSKGHEVEGQIRQEFQDLIGEEIKPVCIESERFPIAGASLDGIGLKSGLLEAKLVGAEA
ncbi:MAG TPA: YqaJ viral recombinase family protein, partial [Bdellovibrionota bacterium]|nr:YqaJ viral recombinase family protein [Bdellovibrionota bacterium]